MSTPSRRGFLLAALSLFFFPLAADNFELPRQVILACAAVAGLAVAPAPNRRTGALLGAWLALALVTTVFSQSPTLSLPALITIAVYACFCLSAFPFEPRPLLWASVPIALYAFTQRLGLDPLSWSEHATWQGAVRPLSTMGHPGHLAAFFAVLLPFALDDAAKTSGLRRAGAGIIIALIGSTVLLTLSRTGWVAAIAGVVTWWSLRRHVFSLQRYALSALGILTLAGAAWQLEWIHTRVRTLFESPSRWHMVTSAWSGFREHPLLGWGLDTFVLVSQKHRVADAWKYEWGATSQHAHALLPQVAATLGIAGLVLLLFATWLIACALWQQHREATLPTAVPAAAVAFTMSLFFTFQSVATSALGLACLAWLLHEGGTPMSLRGWRWPVRGVAIAAAALSTTWLAASVAGRQGYHRESTEAARWYLWAERFDPLNARWPALRGLAFELQAKGGNPAAASESLIAYQRARTIEPRLAQYVGNVARAQALNADHVAAQATFDEAVALAPFDGRIQLDAAEAALRSTDLARTETRLTALLALYPWWGPPWWTLAELRGRQDRRIEERAALEAALHAEWLDWPQGANASRARLAMLLHEEGDDAAALKVLRRTPQAFPDATPGTVLPPP